MSVLIKGIKPPKNCDECDWSWDCAHSEHMDGYEMLGGRPHGCPMIEVQPHGRLIDGDIAEVISFEEADAEGKDFADGVLYAADFISQLPTIIPAEEENT